MNLIRSTYRELFLGMELLTFLLLLIFSVSSSTATWKPRVAERYFDVIGFTLNKSNTKIMQANQSSIIAFAWDEWDKIPFKTIFWKMRLKSIQNLKI